jgi:hypothetical protein
MRHTTPPTEITMRQVQDAAVWRDVVLDAPLLVEPEVYDAIRSKRGAHPDDLLETCGVRVKGGFDSARSRYRFFGKLAKLEAGEAVVVSTIDHETLWLGTAEEYLRMWCVD